MSEPPTSLSTIPIAGLDRAVEIPWDSAMAKSRGIFGFDSMDARSRSFNLIRSRLIELQVKRGGVPTDGDHDQRAVRSPKAAMVRLHGPVADTYYIRLVGAAAYSGVTVQASY